jgi:hypothetical protein
MSETPAEEPLEPMEGEEPAPEPQPAAEPEEGEVESTGGDE